MRILHTIRAWFLPQTGFLLSPAADVLFAGGFSLLTFLVLTFFVARDANIYTWAWAVYYAAFVINYPHFMASYKIMYDDVRPGFFAYRTHPIFTLRLWGAGVVVPLMLGAVFFYALKHEEVHLLSYLVSTMYVLVGWHYIKQIYGCVIVLSAAKSIRYSTIERLLILIPLYLLWGISFVSSHAYEMVSTYQGIPYAQMGIPHAFLIGGYWLFGCSTLVLIGVLGRRYLRTREYPPLSAIAAFCSIVVWYIPAIYHPFYFYIIPLFHSLQYLLFVAAYERNKVSSHDEEGVPTVHRRVHTYLTVVPTLLFIGVPSVVIGMTLWAHAGASMEYLFGVVIERFIQQGTVAGYGALLLLVVLECGISLARWGNKNPYGWYLHTLVTTIVLGIASFSMFPVLFDTLSQYAVLPGWFSYPNTVFGSTVYLFFFTVAINIHHYFIDTVIWKGDNPYVRKHLLQKALVTHA